MKDAGVVLFLFLKLFFKFGGISFGGGKFSGKVVFSCHHKPGVAFYCIYHGKGVFFGPGGLELLFRDGVEVDGDPGGAKLFKDILFKGAPYFQLLDFSSEGRNLLSVVGVAHEHSAGQTFYVSVYLFGLRPFRDFGFLKAFDEAVKKLDFRYKVPGVVVYGLCAAGDVHKAGLLKSFQKFLLHSVK